MACASIKRCFIPSDYFRKVLLSVGSNPTRRIAWSISSFVACFRIDASNLKFSLPDSSGYNDAFSIIIPIFGFASALFFPSNNSLPVLGLTSPAITRINIVFPEPFSPVIPQICPHFMVRQISVNTVVFPICFVMFSSVTSCIISLLLLLQKDLSSPNSIRYLPHRSPSARKR